MVVWLYENVNTRIEGQIVGFDEYMNLVLDEATEVHTNRCTSKTLGRIMLKGDNITLIAASASVTQRRKFMAAVDIALSRKIDLSEGKHQEITEEVRVLNGKLQEYAKNDKLQEYVKTTKEILDKIEPKKDERGNWIDFLIKAIKEKEEWLMCPVCLEVVEAPIYMCQQMHLICAT